jgi:hypothetical protein
LKKKINIYLIAFIAIIIIIAKGISGFKKENAHSENFRNASRLILTNHVKCRMECRQITIEEIKEILEKGDINRAKSGIGSKGDSTFALEGYGDNNQHIRVVVAPENEGLVVITCIDLNKEWPCNCN